MKGVNCQHYFRRLSGHFLSVYIKQAPPWSFYSALNSISISFLSFIFIVIIIHFGPVLSITMWPVHDHWVHHHGHHQNIHPCPHFRPNLSIFAPDSLFIELSTGVCYKTNDDAFFSQFYEGWLCLIMTDPEKDTLAAFPLFELNIKWESHYQSIHTWIFRICIFLTEQSCE